MRIDFDIMLCRKQKAITGSWIDAMKRKMLVVKDKRDDLFRYTNGTAGAMSVHDTRLLLSGL